MCWTIPIWSPAATSNCAMCPWRSTSSRQSSATCTAALTSPWSPSASDNPLMQRITPIQRIALLALPLLLATAMGCKKEFDTPPVRTLPEGSVVTIAQLKAMYQGAPVHFSDSVGAVNTVYGVVTADEQNGNLYKNIHVQDHTGAI